MGSSPISATIFRPTGREFRPVGQAVKTRPFHGCNMGSIPVRVTKSNFRRTPIVGVRLIFVLGHQESARDSVACFFFFCPTEKQPRAIGQRLCGTGLFLFHRSHEQPVGGSVYGHVIAEPCEAIFLVEPDLSAHYVQLFVPERRGVVRDGVNHLL